MSHFVIKSIVLVNLNGGPCFTVPATHCSIRLFVRSLNGLYVLFPKRPFLRILLKNKDKIFVQKRIDISSIRKVELITQPFTELGTGSTNHIDISPGKLSECSTVTFAWQLAGYPA